MAGKGVRRGAHGGDEDRVGEGSAGAEGEPRAGARALQVPPEAGGCALAPRRLTRPKAGAEQALCDTDVQNACDACILADFAVQDYTYQRMGP
ncbi:MAG: hypothetical protein QOD62_2697 [Actinomycetota bacterium]|nr:hypothetical protein [Actinomycetota bacterium]